MMEPANAELCFRRASPAQREYHFLTRLRRCGMARRCHQQTQTKKSNLAAHMGVAPPAISFRLNGRTKISPDWLQEAAAFLGVSLPADAFPIDVAPEPAETTDVAEPDRNADGETDDANDAVSEAENQTETEDSDHFTALI
jgi:transcriptional regulator with XRE-family HTH domain